MKRKKIQSKNTMSRRFFDKSPEKKDIQMRSPGKEHKEQVNPVSSRTLCKSQQ